MLRKRAQEPRDKLIAAEKERMVFPFEAPQPEVRRAPDERLLRNRFDGDLNDLVDDERVVPSLDADIVKGLGLMYR